MIQSKTNVAPKLKDMKRSVMSVQFGENSTWYLQYRGIGTDLIETI